MTAMLETPTVPRRNPMTSLVHSIRRRTLVLGLAVASFAGASGALASLESGSDYAAPEVVQLGYGPGGPPSAGVSPFRKTASEGAGRALRFGRDHPVGLRPRRPTGTRTYVTPCRCAAARPHA